jgi:cytochrome oxidase Cu insertion factor (SCO1/SenC/PrrC family)
MIRRLALASLAALLLATGAPAAEPDFAAMGVRPYSQPKPAPPFALPDLEGRTLRLDDLRGKVTLLFFWATW